MTNRQWLLWQMIEIPPEELAHRLDVEWFCDNFCPSASIRACGGKCRVDMIKWLKQEHEEND